MAEKGLFSGRVRIIFRHSRPIVKIMVVIAIVFSVTALGVLGWSIYDLHSQTEQMRAEAAALEYENGQLESKIQQADSVQGLLAAAAEKLGLVKPGTVIIDAE